MKREKTRRGKPADALLCGFETLLIALLANSCRLIRDVLSPGWIPAFILVFLAANLLPFLTGRGLPGLRLRVCRHGVICLKAFLGSAVFSVVYHIAAAFALLPDQWGVWAMSAVVCILAESILFWNGILCVYGASVQLGIRQRVIGLLCGLIPVVHLFALGGIIRTVEAEVDWETEAARRDEERKGQQLCRTRYPLLLVHGVFFRDYRFPNYWGRIPEALKKNGAQIFYGNHQSAASVENSAAELAARIREIVEKTGCGKVNIIAHSKGGLDCRCAVSREGAAPYVASITTINTPHRGCGFADYLLAKIPAAVQARVASAYNAAMRKLGDRDPDFMAAVRDMTAARCTELDHSMLLPEGVFCQSVGSRLNQATNGKFPLNFTYPLVKYFDGPNDGLVAEESFRWGERYDFLTVEGKRGISHGDMIDLNRENIPGFDVREYYVQLVSGLRQRGL